MSGPSPVTTRRTSPEGAEQATTGHLFKLPGHRPVAGDSRRDVADEQRLFFLEVGDPGE
ncbi:hypothetical protein [Rhodococcus sp. ACT016]|uniref:hypothetical protein n=1 Tax=Rhodococcus sp. ACT016 TaxID=3134808 RepID=UPI003D2893F2